MYDIMLVEDESEVLNSMLETIEWGNFGFNPACGCLDGAQAIEKINAGFVPHAVITDICMPNVDGLHLTEFLREHHSQTLVVVLSGHDEFDYAQKALKLKVFDYVLKPITPYSLQAMLGQIKTELNNRTQHDENKNSNIIKSHFLDRLLNGKMDESLIDENIEKHGLNFKEPYYTVCTLDIDALPNESQQDLELLRYGLHNIANELMENFDDTIVFQGHDGRSNLIINSEAAKIMPLAKERCKEILAAVSAYLKRSASGGIGEICKNVHLLCNSYTGAVEMLYFRFFYGEGSLLAKNDVLKNEKGDFNFSDFEQKFFSAVKQFNINLAENILDDMFKSMIKHRLPFNKCINHCQTLAIFLLHYAEESLNTTELSKLENEWTSSSLFSFSSIMQIQNHIKQFTIKILNTLSLVCNNSTAAQILKAENYIKQNYSNPALSLQAITSYLSISSSHFSSIFKAKTGTTFLEYLTKIRMDKAKEILLTTNKRSYEVAEDVGFSDAHYFSVAFKRVSGFSPREYRDFRQKQNIAITPK